MFGTLQVVEKFLTALSTLDLEQVETLLHEDYAFDLAYDPAGAALAAGVEYNGTLGKAAMMQMFTRLSKTATNLGLWLERSYPMMEPSQLFAEYHGDFAYLNGIKYANDYVGMFTVCDGQIFRWLEFHNPEIARISGEQHRAAAAVLQEHDDEQS